VLSVAGSTVQWKHKAASNSSSCCNHNTFLLLKAPAATKQYSSTAVLDQCSIGALLQMVNMLLTAMAAEQPQ
jgi:alkylhydroperoxidase family enzyme